MNTLSTIIIEDDASHLEILKFTINKYCPDLNIVGVAKNVKEAANTLKDSQFEIVFLDVNLGSDCSFEMLKNCEQSIQDKELIVISSCDKYALEAFKYVATDYILKPIAANKVVKAVEKARKNIQLRKSSAEYNKKINPKNPLKMIAIPSLSEVKIIKVEDIIYLQSEGKYTIFHTSNNCTIVSSKNLGVYEELLAQNNFFRIHHSYLVNMSFALNVQKRDGTYLEIPNQKYLPVSKRKTEPFYRFLGI
ncbi:LytR/AlgR family response regulator transcription factor [Aquimarina mytili]|uniref:Response regulator transcription factor n=1 Tax=Aquimarina mytili TaxID=874423 RepID=A0A937D5L4_9FLAO|nr:LytTR family DNA-binding domain-containing protein [Aquimarina mytili]MBL0683439.1 response regulator transcription factor [Aquimarina mytili]